MKKTRAPVKASFTYGNKPKPVNLFPFWYFLDHRILILSFEENETRIQNKMGLIRIASPALFYICGPVNISFGSGSVILNYA
jgi:hypothetical protein